MKILMATTLSLSLLTAGAALAQNNGSQVEPINVRESKIDGRIDQGVKQGTITGPEAQVLRDEWRSLLQLEADYRKSGGISQQERRDLSTKLSALSSKISDNKQNAQTNPNR